MPKRLELISWYYVNMLPLLGHTKFSKLHDWFRSYNDLNWLIANWWILPSGGARQGSINNGATLS